MDNGSEELPGTGGVVTLTAAGRLQFVEKYFRPESDIHLVLFDGTALRNGMVVLIEDPSQRQDLSFQWTETANDNARINNRWCGVSHVTWDALHVHFLASYDDGLMVKRTVLKHLAWLVDKTRLPEETEEGGDAILYPYGEGDLTVISYQGNNYYRDDATVGDLRNS